MLATWPLLCLHKFRKLQEYVSAYTNILCMLNLDDMPTEECLL